MKNKIIIGIGLIFILLPVIFISKDIIDSGNIFILDYFYGSLKYDKEAWFTKTDFIAHAGGIYMGKDHTNSKEALELFLYRTEDLDTRVVELDFLFTSDDKLVAAHTFYNYGYNSKISYDEFMNSRVLFTPMDFTDVILYMLKNPNLYVMVDTKVENYDNRSIIDVAKYIMANSPQSIKDRFIFQLYKPEQKEEMLKIYDFKNENLVYSLYKLEEYQYIDDILKDCYEYKFNVILFGDGYFFPEDLDRLAKDGIATCTFTINDYDRKQEIIKRKNSLIITDYLFK